MKEKILIIEDEKDLRDAYSAILENEGYDISVAEDFESALERMNDNTISLVFTDIMLGGRTGVDVLREIKQRAAACPVVLITGVPTVKTAAEAVRLGAFDYIPKPVDPETLIRTASAALRFKELQDKYDTSRKNLEAIFKSVRDGIIAVDANLTIVEVNDAIKETCGINKDAIGKPVEPFLEKCSKECINVIKTTIKEKRPVEAYYVTCRHTDRPYQTIGITSYPFITVPEVVSGAVMVIRDETRILHLERELKDRRQYHKIVGSNSKMQEIYSLIEDLTNVDTTVLISGETGTGKELIAEALHYTGMRRERPMVSVNCAALSENLLDSELFGHVKGAFTGAVKDKPGRFEMAEGGTIFLDEIGDISPSLQTKLLRVLQDKKVERVGDTLSREIDVRIVSATNQDLEGKIRNGTFREDLYYRLKVAKIHLPPLRERKEDIPFLIQHFLGKMGRKFNKKIMAVSEDVMAMCMDYFWPGNIRELEHELEYAAIRCRSRIISLNDLSSDFRGLVKTGKPAPEKKADYPEQIRGALEKTGGNKSKAARLLSMSRGTLYKLMKQYNLSEY
ncbi:MAG: sigma 54-interacting transcriptional regulator [Nitrospirota bacterium]